MTTLRAVPETGEDLPSQQIARRIRGLMAELQITGTAMAQEIGLDQRAFSRRYRGVTAWSVDELSALARALHVPFEELVRHQGLEPRTRWLNASAVSEQLALFADVLPFRQTHRVGVAETRATPEDVPIVTGSSLCETPTLTLVPGRAS